MEEVPKFEDLINQEELEKLKKGPFNSSDLQKVFGNIPIGILLNKNHSLSLKHFILCFYIETIVHAFEERKRVIGPSEVPSSSNAVARGFEQFPFLHDTSSPEFAAQLEAYYNRKNKKHPIPPSVNK